MAALCELPQAMSLTRFDLSASISRGLSQESREQWPSLPSSPSPQENTLIVGHTVRQLLLRDKGRRMLICICCTEYVSMVHRNILFSFFRFFQICIISPPVDGEGHGVLAPGVDGHFLDDVLRQRRDLPRRHGPFPRVMSLSSST